MSKDTEAEIDEELDYEPELVDLYAFGHRFKSYPSGLAEDIVTLEREGAIYAHFVDDAKGPNEDGDWVFNYYKIDFQPSEIFQYVEASIAHQEYLQGIDARMDFEEALDSVSNPELAHRVRDYGITTMKDGSTEDIRGCFASFLPDGMEELVCGQLRGRYKLVNNLSDRDGFAELMQILNNFSTAARTMSDRKYGGTPFLLSNEYDVQDVLYTILRCTFDDVKREEWTPQNAGSAKRIDFVIRSIQTVIEVKYVRDNLHARRIADELKIDFECYHERPECVQFVGFIFDPQQHIVDPEQFSNDLSGLRQKRDHSFTISILVR